MEPPLRWLPVRPPVLTSVNATWLSLLAKAVCPRLWLFRTGFQRSLLSPVSRLGSALGLRSPAVWLRVRVMAIACSVRMRGGESIPLWDSSTPLWLLSRHESFEYFFRFFQRTCGFCSFLASSGSHGIATPPFLPNLTVYSRGVPLVGFRLLWRSSGLRLHWQRALRRFLRRFFC